MRSFAAFALVTLAGCGTVEPGAATACNAAGTGRFIGMTGDSETGAAILSATHSAVLRWAPPGYMLTMDFRADRVTVRLGPDNRVTAINCG